MQYVAAYALLAFGGKASPSVADIKELLAEVGVTGSDADIQTLVDGLKGKTLSEVIAEGMKKVGSLSIGGGSTSTSAPAAQVVAPVEKQEAPKPVQKVPEPDDDDVCPCGLFDNY